MFFLPLNILFILVYKSNDKEEEFIIYYKVKKLLCYENNVKYASKKLTTPKNNVNFASKYS